MNGFRLSAPQTLLFDADDTLWENNVYFERAIAAFISYLDHRVHTPEEVREQLNHCERATIAQHGYGLKSFRRSLISCFEQLSAAPLTPEKHARIIAFTESIAAEEVKLLPEVDSTLRVLAHRHRLLLVTKGDREEQIDKVERSGLREFFEAVEVPVEKTAAMYRELISRYHLIPATTWMIGNSPRSDINPALAAGCHAIYIPHDLTWALEQERIDPPSAGQTLARAAALCPSARILLECSAGCCCVLSGDGMMSSRYIVTPAHCVQAKRRWRNWQTH